MKNLKKSLSILLVISMIVSIFAMCGVTSFAEKIISGKCGENSYWEYDADTKTITVSGSGSLEKSSDWQNLDFVNTVKIIKDKQIEVEIKEDSFNDLLMFINTNNMPIGEIKRAKYLFEFTTLDLVDSK